LGEEALVGEDDEEGESTPILRGDMAEVWDWDESSPPVLQPVQARRAVGVEDITPGGSQLTQTTSDEATPLLKVPSTSTQVVSYAGPNAYVGEETHNAIDRSLLRRKSSATLKKPYSYGGQSTYGQTVSIVICLPMSLLNVIDRSVVQQHRDIARHRNAIRAPGLRICWLDRRNSSHCILRLPKLLYVS